MSGDAAPRNEREQLPYHSTIYMPDMDSAFRVFQTHWRVTKPNWTRPLHDHPIFELNLLLDGVQDVKVGENELTMRAGDVLLIPPGVPHHVTGTCGAGVTYFALHFDVEDYMFRAILAQYRCGLHRYGCETEREIRKPLRDLIALLQDWKSRDMSHPALRMKLLSHLFALSAALCGAEHDRLKGAVEQKGGFQIACRLAEQIEKAARSQPHGAAALDLRIDMMAEKLGYSRSYLCRLFRSVFGVSPRKYLSNVTLHRARLELLNPNQSMDRIAEKLGFRDGAHFSKQFKRWTGLSPSEYRLNQQESFLPGPYK